MFISSFLTCTYVELQFKPKFGKVSLKLQCRLAISPKCGKIAFYFASNVWSAEELMICTPVNRNTCQIIETMSFFKIGHILFSSRPLFFQKIQLNVPVLRHFY